MSTEAILQNSFPINQSAAGESAAAAPSPSWMKEVEENFRTRQAQAETEIKPLQFKAKVAMGFVGGVGLVAIATLVSALAMAFFPVIVPILLGSAAASFSATPLLVGLGGAIFAAVSNIIYRRCGGVFERVKDKEREIRDYRNCIQLLTGKKEDPKFIQFIEEHRNTKSNALSSVYLYKIFHFEEQIQLHNDKLRDTETKRNACVLAYDPADEAKKAEVMELMQESKLLREQIAECEYIKEESRLNFLRTIDSDESSRLP
jgi:hypothetical protein